MYLETVSDEAADGEIAEIYAAERADMGMVMNATRSLSARPDMAAPVERLLHQLRDGFSLGLEAFRMITLVVAKHVPSSYCSHVYFRGLTRFVGREQALAIQSDHRTAGLSARDVAMLDYAEQIATDASRIGEADIQRLRDLGFSDLNIADIAYAAAFRCFLSRYFDAVGATAEPDLLDDDPAVRAQLAVGKR
ncbi:carboxymuconolactone decarboxylase family protein [Microbacterium paludicola]|uniref:carboxymuconolactone decarboxylase family protein n=1 Tax=Microbacterium paludicola TaxID=300019 RepID=UPI0031E3F18D